MNSQNSQPDFKIVSVSIFPCYSLGICYWAQQCGQTQEWLTDRGTSTCASRMSPLPVNTLDWLGWPSHPLWTAHYLMPPSPLVLPARANLGPGINTTSSSHCSYFILYIQPLKMELIKGSETSANHNRTPGKYPKEYILVLYNCLLQDQTGAETCNHDVINVQLC